MVQIFLGIIALILDYHLALWYSLAFLGRLLNLYEIDYPFQSSLSFTHFDEPTIVMSLSPIIVYCSNGFCYNLTGFEVHQLLMALILLYLA